MIGLPEATLFLLILVAGIVLGDELRRQQVRKYLARELQMSDEELARLHL